MFSAAVELRGARDVVKELNSPDRRTCSIYKRRVLGN